MHEYFMSLALEQAKISYLLDEVPVGAVIVKDGEVVAAAHNSREILKDSSAHAEMLAIHDACKRLGGWRLIDCDMYVTLEPCPMCAGAMVNARIRRVVFGASDPKAGACGTLFNVADDPRLNHRIEIVSGIMEEECSNLLKQFFRRKRK